MALGVVVHALVVAAVRNSSGTTQVVKCDRSSAAM